MILHLTLLQVIQCLCTRSLHAFGMSHQGVAREALRSHRSLTVIKNGTDKSTKLLTDVRGEEFDEKIRFRVKQIGDVNYCPLSV